MDTTGPDGDNPMLARARKVMELAENAEVRIATAESCTGGLLATTLTDLPGVSHCFECGFVVYSDSAKTALLGVPDDLLAEHGAVSKPVACAMAEQAIARSRADLAIAITGFAGPGDDGEGLVHLALARTDRPTWHSEHNFGAVGRDRVRSRTLEAALDMLDRALQP